MTRLTLYGGVNEIGGNKILLEDEETRFFLDFGKSFAIEKKFFDQYLKPRKLNMIDELISFGQLPSMEGVYREDYLEHVDQNHELLSRDGTPAVDGVIITHAHMDHIGMIPYLRPDIPLFGSEITECIMRYWQDASSGDQSEYLEWCPSFQIRPSKGKYPTLRADIRQLGEEIVTRDFTHLKDGQSQMIGDIEILSYPVDHSLPGAYAYILKTPAGNIGYTGDLRLHGYSPEITERFIQALENSAIKVLLCEGTREDKGKGVKEAELTETLAAAFERTEGLVLANYSTRDVSRIYSMAKAATDSGRTLLIDPKQAYYLSLISGENHLPCPSGDDFEVLLPRKGWGIWSDSSIDERLRKQDYSYAKPIKEYIFDNLEMLTPEEVAAAQSDYVVTCSFYDLCSLHDLKPGADSSYIWSRSDPFDDEGQIEYERVLNWMSHFNIDTPVTLHCSGHISVPEIQQLIERAQPEIVVPVHTDNPEKFRDWHDDVRILTQGDSVTM